MMQFSDLPLIKPLAAAIAERGYTHPTPIQQQSIPPILEGRDILGCAQTGTGKTAAFAIPTLQRLFKNREQGSWHKGIKALIVTPTRELAIQIDESFTAYGKGLGLKHTVIFGGVKQHSQVRKLRGGIDVLVATPGRLLDLMNQGFIDLGKLQIFTLDEADRMLDMGFIHDIKKIIARLPRKRQSLFFSATMPDSILNLANSLLYRPIKVEVAVVSSTAETVEQKVYYTEKGHKRNLLVHVLKDEDVASAIVFTRTKHGADKLTKHLRQNGFSAEAIHGNKSQNARQRALKNFKAKETQLLIATDIASRGIDVKELSHVINFEVPNEPETYVHRIGRTGRAEASGVAISLCDVDEQNHIHDIHHLIKKTIPEVKDHPYEMPESKRTSKKVKKKKSTRPRSKQLPPSRRRNHDRKR